MRLADYLAENGIDHASFAGEVGVTKKAVQLWLAGERHPRLEQMQKIADATNGKVMPNDFLPSRAEELGEEAHCTHAQETPFQEASDAPGDSEQTPAAAATRPTQHIEAAE